MKILKQNCSKCDAKIKAYNININQAIYVCDQCHVIGSIFDENTYDSTISDYPDNISIEETDGSIVMKFNNHSIKPKNITGSFLLFIYLLLFFVLVVFLVSWFLGFLAFGLFILILIGIEKLSIVSIEISPSEYNMKYKLGSWMLAQFQCESYMIDQLSIKTNDSQYHVLRMYMKNGKLIPLMYVTKNDRKQLEYMEQFCESSLGIRNRVTETESGLST